MLKDDISQWHRDDMALAAMQSSSHGIDLRALARTLSDQTMTEDLVTRELKVVDRERTLTNATKRLVSEVKEYEEERVGFEG
jgi:hypothetical protein